MLMPEDVKEPLLRGRKFDLLQRWPPVTVPRSLERPILSHKSAKARCLTSYSCGKGTENTRIQRLTGVDQHLCLCITCDRWIVEHPFGLL